MAYPHAQRALTSITALVLATSSISAHAHHGMEGQLPNTFAQGLISGLAHPVIGLDHLAFIVAAACLIARFGATLRAGLCAAFVLASVLGTVVHLQSVDLPGSELLIALSVLAAGALVWSRRLAPSQLLWVALPIAGLLHGYAYGESIVGAQTSVLTAYLLGFVLIQWGVMFGIACMLNKLEAPRFARAALLSGALITIVGLWFSIDQTMGLLA
ncbi:HupE/UreJ family protein [Comamonas composti]|uniref:HupE/UreJ family protein n=1 Tax=Comamonas composti TaxID=408558 RepID=UPI0003FA146C|nr:HupE/UreJ family protein [Comamonas composti]